MGPRPPFSFPDYAVVGGTHGAIVKPYGNGESGPAGLLTESEYQMSSNIGTSERCAITLAVFPNGSGMFVNHQPVNGVPWGIRTTSPTHPGLYLPV